MEEVFALIEILGLSSMPNITMAKNGCATLTMSGPLGGTWQIDVFGLNTSVITCFANRPLTGAVQIGPDTWRVEV